MRDDTPEERERTRRFLVDFAALLKKHGLTIRVHGDKGGLEWHQEEPNRLLFSPLGAPKQVMTRGGPLGKTTTLVYQVYSNAFESSDTMGYACAVAYVLFAIIAVFSVVESKLLKQS